MTLRQGLNEQSTCQGRCSCSLLSFGPSSSRRGATRQGEAGLAPVVEGNTHVSSVSHDDSDDSDGPEAEPPHGIAVEGPALTREGIAATRANTKQQSCSKRPHALRVSG